jgi:hypothetical protein
VEEEYPSPLSWRSRHHRGVDAAIIVIVEEPMPLAETSKR